jgi:hypothetical protein
LECFTPPPGTPDRDRFIQEHLNPSIGDLEAIPAIAIDLAQRTSSVQLPMANPVSFAPFYWWPPFVEFATSVDGTLGGMIPAVVAIDNPLQICNALTYDEAYKDFTEFVKLFASPIPNYEQRQNFEDSVLRARTFVISGTGCARFCALDSLRGLLWFLWTHVDMNSNDQASLKNFLRALVHEMLKNGRPQLNIHFLLHFAIQIAGEMGLQHFLLSQAVSGWEESLRELRLGLGQNGSNDLRLHWAMLLTARSYVLTLQTAGAAAVLADPELAQYKTAQTYPVTACEDSLSKL